MSDRKHPFEPHPTDSAGQPWAGRSFQPTGFEGDDGSIPAAFAEARTALANGQGSETAVVAAVRTSRLLIPLVATLGEGGEGAHGLHADKSADLAIVTVAGPDGVPVVPVFSHVQAMSAWNPAARPVPADARRVALAAADEGVNRVIIDPGADTVFALRRPALWAIAQDEAWTSPADDPEVLVEIETAASAVPEILGVRVVAGDPAYDLTGSELLIAAVLPAGLTPENLQSVGGRLNEALQGSAVIAQRVDSLGVRFLSLDQAAGAAQRGE